MASRKKKENDVEQVVIPEFKPEEMPPSCTWIIIGPPASGKCLAKDTRVLMYDGTTRAVQELKENDRLMGDDSTPRRILSVANGTDMLYKITDTNSGESYTVNDPHILCLKSPEGYEAEITAAEYFDFLHLAPTPSEGRDTTKGDFKGYRTPVDFKAPAPYLNPYTFGISIGKCFVGQQTTLGSGAEISLIPMSYVINTRDVRQKFLAGVLETCGKVGEEPGVIFMPVSGNIRMANEIQFLARSLGFVSYYNKDTLSIQGNLSVLSPNYSNMTPDLTYPITIERMGSGEYYGFETNGNHKFVLADLTVTHNTSLMENFAYYLKHRYPVARAFIGTEDGYKRFCNIFHPLYVSNYWDEKEEESHVKRQRTCEMDNGRGYIGNYAINIIDDVGDDPKHYKTKLMRGLFKLGSQHWAQLLMIGSQYAIDMPPDIRKSVSYVAIGREPEMGERRKLYDNFGGMAGSFERFCDLMDQITGDYTFLIFKKRSQSNKLEECVSWYRTRKLGDWKFGCSEYKNWATARYDTNYVEQIIM